MQKQGIKGAFIIAELVIVVCIIGILAAIVVPLFQNNATEAEVATAKDNLRVLRGVVELYAANHKDVPPGYPDDNPNDPPTADDFSHQTTVEETYLRAMPRNPFNNLSTMRVIGNSEVFPAEATGDFGWIYKPASRTVCLDWPGQDDKGIRYFDY
jgi:type II secretory pathway pseudopilin PulG